MNKLGFGLLRLPQVGGKSIDWPLLEAMVDEFLASGGTYFDTAYTYLDGMSEAALKRAVVERHPRTSFQIADKLPGWKVKRQEDCQRYFSEQLERCGVDFFDVYLLHWLNQTNYAIAERFDEFGFLNRLKAEGRIGKTGFSYHGDAATLERILQAHPDVDVVQLQINYLDWDDPAMEAHKCYDIAARFGKEIVVMEPVKGGTLADPPQEAVQLLRQAAPKESMASWAIRFAQSLEQVSIVLSGMNTMEQMRDNMRDMVPLSRSEYALLEQASAIIAKSTAIPCTGCRYCVKECPKGIAIPDYFRIYNGYSRFPAEGWKMEPVYASIAQTNGRASDCIHCHACERNCPQQIPITNGLQKLQKPWNKQQNGGTNMKKRFLCFSMAVCMVCLLTMTSCSAAEIPAVSSGNGLDSAKLTSESQPTVTFSDVPADAWYAEAINYCQQNGIMSGTSATTFAPETTLTRAMLATVLYRMSGTPTVSDAPVFTDAVAGSWYSDAVSWAAKNSIISGYGGDTFGVDDPTTREQAVTILWRYAGEPEGAAAADISDAASVSTWAQTAVRWANANGILEGMTNNSRFDPKTNIKRGEVASMLYHYLSNTTSSQPEPAAGGKTLVAYFSATNTTRPLAEYAADILGADLVEIVPEVPYTDADLAYYTNGRADREQNDSSARPTISGSVENMADYDVIFLGYPIWHGQPPRIISTFLESYDFAEKTIVPFCTSHSSGYSDSSIKSLAPDANWITGCRFAGGTSRSTVEEWINGLALPQPETAVDAVTSATSKAGFNFETKSVTLNSGYEMPINGLGTYSLHGETCVNSVKSALRSGVRLIDTASAYGNEEEVGQAIRDAIDEGVIKREDVFVITKIYPGSEMANPEQSIQACLDRLDIGYVDMMLLHHPDRNDVKAYQAMEKFVEEGKIRSLGLSNWYVEELESFLPQVTVTPALVQNEIHPYYQENDVIPYIQDLGIVVQGWYPLGGRGHTAELLGDEVISSIAKAHSVSSAQVILRWNLQKGVVVIPGSSNPDHIKENTELYGFELTDAEMAQINALDRNEKHDWY